MENKSKKNAAIFMIIGGILVMGNYGLKLESQKDNTNTLIIMACAAIFAALGMVSLRNTLNKTSKK